MTTLGEIMTLIFNFLKLALFHFKWVLEFLLYHPLYSLRLHHHQPLQEFQIFTEEEEEEVDCAVCLNKIIGEGEEVRVLRCEHVFHRDCLNQWVGLRNLTCPLCRDFLGYSETKSVHGEGSGEAHVLFFKFSSSSHNYSERYNRWLR